MITAFLQAPLSATARDVEHQYLQHIQYVAVDDPRLAMNVDTPEDYARLASAEMLASEKLV
jgi:GTP:adenosylcobinamide-phosphate guanylyltransferase